MVDRATATSATGLAARTASATRAERFVQIAERAHLRAQIRSEQLAAAIKLEFLPRAGTVFSTGLLIREEVAADTSVMSQIVRRLKIHCIGTTGGR